MRDWRSQRVTENGAQFWGYWFSCNECGSVATYRTVHGMGERTASEVVPKKMRERGWLIGKRTQDGKCPACVSFKTKPTPPPASVEAMLPALLSQPAPEAEAPKVEPPKVEAPKVEPPKVEAPKVETPVAQPDGAPFETILTRAAAHVGVPNRSLSHAAKRGVIPSRRVGKFVYIKISDAEHYARTRVAVPADRLKKRAETIARKSMSTTMSHAFQAAQEQSGTLILAPPVRTPTRDQRRKIIEALDDVYPKPEQGYSGSMSDELLAKRLDMPRAWIAEIRDQLYGPEVVVDVKSYMTRLAILEQQVREFETKVLEQADTLNKQLAQAKRELEEVKARFTSGGK